MPILIRVMARVYPRETLGGTYQLKKTNQKWIQIKDDTAWLSLI